MSIETYFDTVQKLYIAYYQRPADPNGLVYWAKALEAAKGDVNQIIDYFANSPKSQSLYAGMTVSQRINAIYNAAFDRDAEPQGLAYWADVVKNGYTTIGKVLWEIIKPGSPQGNDLTTLNNKLISANNFTRVIDPELDGKDFQVTYEGNTDAQIARNFLKNVDSD